MSITQNPPINPTRGGHNDQMRRLEALFGGSKSNSAPTASSVFGGPSSRGVPTSRANIEAKFAAAFKNGPDASSDGNSVSGNTNGQNPQNSALSKAPSAYRLRLERIKNATNDEELFNAIEVFLNSHDLPNDIGVILKVLRHPDEALVRKGLAELVGMLSRRELAGTTLVREALANLAARPVSSETKSYLDGLQTMLATYKS